MNIHCKIRKLENCDSVLILTICNKYRVTNFLTGSNTLSRSKELLLFALSTSEKSSLIFITVIQPMFGTIVARNFHPDCCWAVQWVLHFFFGKFSHGSSLYNGQIRLNSSQFFDNETGFKGIVYKIFLVLLTILTTTYSHTEI